MVIKWLTASEERTPSTFGTVMQNTLCRKRGLSSLQNSGFCSKTVHSYVLQKWFWALLMLKHELWGQKLGSNREEMKVTAVVLLKVSEDDLLHVFEKWVECCKKMCGLWRTRWKKDTSVYPTIRRACFFPVSWKMRGCLIVAHKVKTRSA